MTKFLNGKNFVVAVSAEPLDGVAFTAMDVKIVWYTGAEPVLNGGGELVLTDKHQVSTPDNMVKVDDNTWLALVKSEVVGRGSIMCNVYAKFKDANFPGEERKEYIRLPARISTV